jgi:glucose-6-phosphate 1-dehydrogenase
MGTTEHPASHAIFEPIWNGVPFTPRSGKARAADSAEIATHFRPPSRYPPRQWPGVEPNVPTVGPTKPCWRLSTTLNGPKRTAEIRPARGAPGTATVHRLRPPDPRHAQQQPMLFIRGDEAEEAWRIIDPVMNAWTTGNVPRRNTQSAKHHQDPPADPCRPIQPQPARHWPGQDRHAQPAGPGTAARTRTAS